MDNDDDPLDNLIEHDPIEEQLIPADIDEDQDMSLHDKNLGDEDEDEDEEEDVLQLLGSEYRNIGVRSIFDALKSRSRVVEAGAPIILSIVQELRPWIVVSVGLLWTCSSHWGNSI